MSQRFNIVEDFPAVTYVEFTNTDKANKVFSGELIKLKSNRTTQKLATVISCAVENSQDPIAELETAIKFGHDTHFAFSIGSSLTAHKQEKKQGDNQGMLQHTALTSSHPHLPPSHLPPCLPCVCV